MKFDTRQSLFWNEEEKKNLQVFISTTISLKYN